MPRNERETWKKKEVQFLSVRTTTFPQTEIEEPSKDNLSGIATLAGTPQNISLHLKCAQRESWKKCTSPNLSQTPIRRELMSWAATRRSGANTIV